MTAHTFYLPCSLISFTYQLLVLNDFAGDQRWAVEEGHGLPESGQWAELHDPDCDNVVWGSQ